MTIIGNKIIPADGKMLYNGTAYSDLVYLGEGASADDWQEVDPPVYEEENDHSINNIKYF